MWPRPVGEALIPNYQAWTNIQTRPPVFKTRQIVKRGGRGREGQQCLPLDWSLQILHNTSQPCNITTTATTTGLQFISLRLSNKVLSLMYICFYKWQAGSKLYQEQQQQQQQGWWYEEVKVDNAIQQRAICHSDPLSERWRRSRLSEQVRFACVLFLMLIQIYLRLWYIHSQQRSGHQYEICTVCLVKFYINFWLFVVDKTLQISLKQLIEL